jgi:hypothetical protein
MAKQPELRMDNRGKFTPASLRDHFRFKISHIDGMDRDRYAYGVLSEAIVQKFSGTQLRAIARGLALGMSEGVR